MLDLPKLPAAARLAHIIPGAALHSFFSVVTLCNTGYNKLDVLLLLCIEAAKFCTAANACALDCG
jgi:hypothetical protein